MRFVSMKTVSPRAKISDMCLPYPLAMRLCTQTPQCMTNIRYEVKKLKTFFYFYKCIIKTHYSRCSIFEVIVVLNS